MRQLLFGVIIAGVLALAACGSNSNNGNINGNWTASLMSSNNGAPVFNFGLSMTQMSGGSLSVTNLNFSSGQACFQGGASATGGFSVSGNFNGNVSGALTMNIQGTSLSNQLSLQGTVNNNVVTGNWTLTGTTAGCTGSGTFTMNKS